MTILALVNADKEGQIESKMMKARQMEEIREARRKEAEQREQTKKNKLEETKNDIKKRRKKGKHADVGPNPKFNRQDDQKPEKRVAFAKSTTGPVWILLVPHPSVLSSGPDVSPSRERWSDVWPSFSFRRMGTKEAAAVLSNPTLSARHRWSFPQPPRFTSWAKRLKNLVTFDHQKRLEKNLLWSETYWLNGPSGAIHSKPTEMSSERCRAQHSKWIGAKFPNGQRFFDGNLESVSLHSMFGRAETLTGSSVAFMAKSGVRTARSESQEDASRSAWWVPISFMSNWIMTLIGKVRFKIAIQDHPVYL